MAPRADGRADWYCKHCPDDRNAAQQFRNFASRLQCKKCGIAKGKCFKSNVEPKAPTTRPAKTLAVRQVAQQRQTDAESKRVASLQRENAQLQKKLAALQSSDKAAAPEEEEEAAEGTKHEYTLAQLREMRTSLVRYGKTSVHPDVLKLDQQISLQQEEQHAGLPSHVRVAKADKRVAAAERKVGQVVDKHAKMEQELSQLKERIEAQRVGIEQAQMELQEAAKSREELFKDLKAASADGPAGAEARAPLGLSATALFTTLAQFTDSLAETDVQGLLPKAQLASVFEGLHKVCEAKQQAQMAEAAAAAEAAEKAAANAGAAQIGGPRRPWADVADEPDEATVEMELDMEQARKDLPTMDADTREHVLAVLAKSFKPVKKTGTKAAKGKKA